MDKLHGATAAECDGADQRTIGNRIASEEEALISELLGRIKAAERGADDAVRKARAESKRLITEAHDQVDRTMSDTRGKARDVEKALVEKARVEAEAEAQKIVEKSATEVDAASREGEARIAAAVKKVLGSISA